MKADVVALHGRAALGQQIDAAVAGEAGGFHQHIEIAAADQRPGLGRSHAAEQPVVVGLRRHPLRRGIKAAGSHKQLHGETAAVVVIEKGTQKRAHHVVADLGGEKADPQTAIGRPIRSRRQIGLQRHNRGG